MTNDLRKRLDELFVYDEENGFFVRRQSAQKSPAGSIAGTKAPTHWAMRVDGRTYPRARLVWLWHTGALPNKILLKRNGNSYDDRFSNLRLAGPAVGRRMDVLTADELRDLLSYDPDEGVFRWRRDGLGKRKAGAVAGSGGQRPTITINNRNHSAHRLAWLYMTGSWPSRIIDHIDCNPRNNRWSNLRQATHSQNSCNLRGRASSGFKGVYRSGTNTWRASIALAGKSYRLGTFSTREDAAKARQVFAEKLHGEFARHD